MIFDPLEKLKQAIDEFVQESSNDGTPRIVRDCVVIWETTRFDEDGRQLSRVQYAIPNEGTSMAACSGLVHLGAQYIDRDIINETPDG